jgi:hypothetical protein
VVAEGGDMAAVASWFHLTQDQVQVADAAEAAEKIA